MAYQRPIGTMWLLEAGHHVPNFPSLCCSSSIWFNICWFVDMFILFPDLSAPDLSTDPSSWLLKGRHLVSNLHQAWFQRPTNALLRVRIEQLEEMHGWWWLHMVTISMSKGCCHLQPFYCIQWLTQLLARNRHFCHSMVIETKTTTSQSNWSVIEWTSEHLLLASWCHRAHCKLVAIHSTRIAWCFNSMVFWFRSSSIQATILIIHSYPTSHHKPLAISPSLTACTTASVPSVA